MAEHVAHDAHGEQDEDAVYRSPHPHSDLPHVNMWVFIRVFFALCVLTAISFAAANAPFLHDAPSVKWVIMLAVSCVKALLVISFFMHLMWEASWKYVLTIPASIMSILLMLLLVPDIGRRVRNYSEERLRYAAAPETEAHETHEAHGKGAKEGAGEKAAAAHHE